MIHEFDTLDSTQNKAKELIELNQAQIGDIVWCHEQTAGRGRGNNQWQAQAGATLTCTLIAPSIATGEPPLSLIVGALLAQQLNQLSSASELVQIKWPNDLYFQGKKLGGILIENNRDYSLIGIGINVNSTPLLENLQAVALDSLFTDQMNAIELDFILDQVIQALNPIIEQKLNLTQIWSHSYNYIQKHQLYLNQLVKLNYSGQELQGVICGIDQQGCLLLQTKHGVQPIIQASNIKPVES